MACSHKPSSGGGYACHRCIYLHHLVYFYRHTTGHLTLESTPLRDRSFQLMRSVKGGEKRDLNIDQFFVNLYY